MISQNVVNDFFTGLNNSSSGGGSSSGNDTVSRFFSQFPTQKVTQAPIKTVQAPSGGFKINLVTPSKSSANQTTTQPTLKSNTSLSLAGIPTVSNFTPDQKQLNPSQLMKIQAPDIPKKQSSSNNITPSNESLAQSTIQTLNELKIDPLSLKADPKKAVGDYFKGITDSFTSAKNDIQNIFNPKATTSQKVGSGLKGGAEAVNTVLSPITSFFNAANDIPVLGSVNKLISLPFNIVGDLGHTIAYPIVNTLPISKQQKTDIVDGVGEVIALAGQIALGGKIEGMKEGLVERFGKKDANTIITKAQDIAKQQVESKPVLTGEHTPQEVIDHVINNKIDNTADGKVLLKTAVDAQKQGMNIDIKDANKAVNEANTSKVVSDTLQGNREDARLNSDKNLSIAKASNESIPKDATPETKVSVYRAGSDIKAGDHVTFSRENATKYASQREGVSVRNISVPLKDLTFSNGLKSEAIYAPKEVPKVSEEKVSFNSSQAKAVQKAFLEKLQKANLESKTQEELIANTEKIVNDVIQQSGGDKVVLSGVRTALSKELQTYAGNNGSYKADYAMLQQLKEDPSIGKHISSLEDSVFKVDKLLLMPQLEALKLIKTEQDAVLNPIIDKINSDIMGNNGNESNKVSQTKGSQAIKATDGKSVENIKESSTTSSKSKSTKDTKTSTGDRVNSRGKSESSSNASTKSTDTASGNGEGLTPSKLGLRVDQTSIEKGLGELKSIPGYEKINMEDQAKRATDLINSDPQKAYDIALGKVDPPKGLTAESVFKAVEKSITKPEQAIELANSPLVSEASRLGQRIKSLDVKTSDSPVEAIKQVMEARKQTIETKLGKTITQATTDTIKDIKKEVSKTAPKKLDWATFIKEVQCK